MESRGKGLWVCAVIIAGTAFFNGCQSTALTSAKLYIQQDDWDKATAQLEAAVSEKPTDAEAWMLLGVARANQGQFVESGEAFARAIDDPGKRQEATRLRQGFWAKSFNAGVDALRTEDYAKAATSFEAARALDPASVDAARNLGYAYYQLDRTGEAVDVYRGILEMDPADEDTALRLGYLYYNDGDYENTVALLAGLATDSDDAQLLGALAISYDALGQEEEALAVLEAAQAAGVASPEMLMELGRMYWNISSLDRAEDVYRQATVLEPDNPDMHHNRAMALLELKRDSDATPVLERVVELDPEMGDAWYWLGVVYARQNRVSQSEAAFQKAASLGVE